MPVEIFSKAEFEKALPVHKESKKKMWKEEGLKDGEYVYSMKAKNDVVIMIRSSVRENKMAAASGLDSIRCWLVKDGKPFGNKGRSSKRVRGWQRRLTEMLRELWSRSTEVDECPICKKPMAVWTVQKKGRNHGRKFRVCWDHKEKTFEWLTPRKEN